MKQPFSIILCSYLFSKWRKAAFKSLFHFAVFQKRLKKQCFGAEYNFFCKRISIRMQTIPECIPNLLGHPVVVCWPEAVLTLVVALKRPLESEAKEEMRFLDLLRQTTRPP